MKNFKRLAAFALLLALLPTGMTAQTLVVDPESGLEYLDDGDGKLYIDVGSNAATTINGTRSNIYFIPDDGLRPKWRSDLNGGNGKWYKTALDAITEVKTANNGWTTFKGVEYFRNLETLVIPSKTTSNVTHTLDLSKNTKLSSLTFSYPDNIKIGSIDISNTQLTKLTIPSKSKTTLKSFTAKNATNLNHLDFSSNSVLETIDLSGCTSLNALSLPEATTALKSLDVSNTGLTSLNLKDYTNLSTLYADAGVSLNLPANLALISTKDGVRTYVVASTVTSLTLDVSDEDAAGKAVDLSNCTHLKDLTLIGATSLTMASTLEGSTELTLDLSGSPDLATITSLPSNITSLTLDVSGNGEISEFPLPTTLQYLTLDASDCEKLTTLDLSSLNSLFSTTLNLSKNEQLTSLTLPTTLGYLNYLTLDLSGDEKIASLSLPTTLARLTLNATDCDDLAGIDLSACTSLSEINLTAVKSVTMGEITNQTSLSFSTTDCPDLVVDLGTQSKLTSLILTNMNQVDISGCSALYSLTCKGASWGDLRDGHLGLICNTGATEASPTLPNLQTLKTWDNTLKRLDLTNAALNLTSAINTTNINLTSLQELIIPGHKKAIVSIPYQPMTLKKIDISGCNVSGTLDLNHDYDVEIPLEELHISGTSISELIITRSQLKVLNAQDLDNYLTELSVCDHTTLETVNLSGSTSLTEISLRDNINLTSVDLTGCSKLESINVSGSSSLTSLPLPASSSGVSNVVKILNVGNTGMTSLDVSREQKLEALYVNKAVSPLTLPEAPYNTLELLATKDGVDTYAWSGVTTLTLDVSEVENAAAELSNFKYLKKLTLIGAKSLTLASGSDLESPSFELDVTDSPALNPLDLSAQTEITSLTLKGAQTTKLPATLPATYALTATDSPDFATDLGEQTALTTLTLTDINQIDISKCDALQTLYCKGTEWGDLTDGHLGLVCNTDAAEDSWTLPALTRIDAEGSGVRRIDMTNAASLLNNVNVMNSLTKELRVPNHTSFNTILTKSYSNNRNSTGYLALGYNSISPWISTGGDFSQLANNNRLEILDISGCTNITEEGSDGDGVLLTVASLNYNKAPMRELYAKDCTSITKIKIYNSDLEELDVRGCTALTHLWAEQNYLKTIKLAGCNSLESFLAKRCKFEDVSFLTDTYTDEDGYERTVESIAKLRSVQLNGGSYATQIWEDSQKKVVIPAVFTNKIRTFNTANLGFTLETLLVADNLLQTINIHSGLTRLQELQIENNMLLTLDLSVFGTGTGKIPVKDLKSNCHWGWDISNDKIQVAFHNVEVVKGKAVDGSDDWVALPLLDQGGYEHLLDNTLGLYPSLYDARYSTNQIAKEANPFMGTVEQFNSDFRTTHGYGEVIDDEHTGEHLFLHSMRDIKIDNGWKWDENSKTFTKKGSWLDQDLYGKVLRYRYDTQFNYNESEGKGQTYGSFDNHIEIRAHIWPYILNINPATLDDTGTGGDNSTGVKDYYSSTIYLDYDAVIPNGVKCYVVTGFQNVDGYLHNNVTKTYDQQLVMKHVGSPGEVLPARTPVIVISDGESKAAGLYAFQTAWDFDFQGWEDYRTGVIREARAKELGLTADEAEELLIPQLHGVNDDHIIYKPQYDPAIGDNKELWVNLKNSGEFASALENNILQGTLEDMPVANDEIMTLGRQKAPDADGNVSMRLGFWRYRGGKLGAHRCYIPYATLRDTVEDGAAKAGAAFYFNHTATGIATVESGEQRVESTTAVYDLQGRKVADKYEYHALPKGFYVVNGKKIVVK